MIRIKRHAPRIVAMLLVLLLCIWMVPAVSAAPTVSGKCGGLKWSLAGGVLTLTGKGEMPDFTEQKMAPWYEYRTSIARVELGTRITSIGSLAFYECTALTSIDLPDKTTKVGDMAFSGCTALRMAAMPAVETLGEYAFSRCVSLTGVILPDTLVSIGYGAFYRCESIRTIRIPLSVKTLGGSAFAYCSSLVRAEIDASLNILPEWTFYGCDRLKIVFLPKTVKEVGDAAFTRCDVLTTVYYDGNEQAKKDLVNDIAEGLKEFDITRIEPTPDSDVVVEDKGFSSTDNELAGTTTEIIENEDVVIESQIIITRPIKDNMQLGDGQEMDIIINATLRDDDGWDDVIKEIEKQAIEQGAFEMEYKQDVTMTAQVRLLETNILSGEILKQLAGQDMILQIHTKNGSCWSIDCQMLKGYEFKKSYDMRYTLSLYEKPSRADKKTLGTATAYWLSFADKIDFPSVVELYVDLSLSRQIATLYEDSWGKGLQKLQSVMVDESGTAFYRMSNINKGERYVVAINVNGITSDEVIIPEDYASEFGDTEEYVPITEQYIITDVRGFLGLTMKEFTSILLWGFGGLIALVIVITVILSIASKKKTEFAFSFPWRKKNQ